MRTKIRLIINIVVQLLLVFFVLLQLINQPASAASHLGWFAFCISIWQIGHAIYVVQKYHDWYHRNYLKNIKTITRVSFWIGTTGAFAWLLTAGKISDILVVMSWLSISLWIVMSVIAIHYLVKSIQFVYLHLIQPRSFWDL